MIGFRFAFVVALVPSLGQAQNLPPAEVEKFVSQFLTDSLPGTPAAFVLVQRGQIVCRLGFGRDAPRRERAVDPEATVFYAASVGKLFVATAIMQLVEQGRLSLDDDVNRHLKQLQLDATYPEPVTVRHLLTHTAGFAERFLGAQVADASELQPLGDYLAGRMPPRVRPPGLQCNYSNHGMALAGHLVEAISGERFDEYCERHIFAPLGMTASSFRQPLPAALAERLVFDPRGPAPALLPYPAGALATTPADLGRFLAAHAQHGGAILKPETAALMHRQHFAARPDMPGVALGFFESTFNGRRVLFHTGDRGDHALALLLPDEQLGFYLVHARGWPIREEFTRRFFNQFYPAPAATVSPAAPTASAERYAGLYRAGSCPPTGVERVAGLTRQLHFRAGEFGTLWARLGLTGPEVRLEPVAPGLFRTDEGMNVSFREDASGRVTLIDYAGGLSDPAGAVRIAAYEDVRFHLAALVVFGTVPLSRCLLMPLLLARRLFGRARPAESGAARAAWALSGAVCLFFVGGPLLAYAAVDQHRGPIFSLTPLMRAGLVLPVVGALLGLTLSVFAVLAYRRQWWTRVWRVYYVYLALAFLVIVPILAYWGLLGWPA